jgi:hypothetical protein
MVAATSLLALLALAQAKTSPQPAVSYLGDANTHRVHQLPRRDAPAGSVYATLTQSPNKLDYLINITLGTPPQVCVLRLCHRLSTKVSSISDFLYRLTQVLTFFWFPARTTQSAIQRVIYARLGHLTATHLPHSRSPDPPSTSRMIQVPR